MCWLFLLVEATSALVARGPLAVTPRRVATANAVRMLELPKLPTFDLEAVFKRDPATLSREPGWLSQAREVSGYAKRVAAIEARGLTLSRKSKDARKAADMLFILTLVFSFISVVIMGVAAVNITHTFLMILTERRYEIGILRAIGASRAEIQRLVLAEAALVGVFGAIVGELVMLGGTWIANVAAERWLAGVPFKPDDFFVTDWRVLVGAIFFALVFCVIGAALPARRAAHMDPARVLVS